MKKFLLIPFLLLCLITFSQNELPTPFTEAGQNLELEAVAELFATSSSIEEFEIALNTPSNDINNLDLNQDGYVNYIRTEEKVDGLTHVIFLRVPLADNQVQDIASIEIEKQTDETVTIQVVGDETIYGENYIVTSQLSADEFKKLKQQVAVTKGDFDDFEEIEKPEEELIVEENNTENINYTSVVYMYKPHYNSYSSPYHHHHYPPGYKPYKPVSKSVYHSRVGRYKKKTPHTKVIVARSSRAIKIQKTHHKAAKHTTHKKTNHTTHRKQPSRSNKKNSKHPPRGKKRH